MFTCGLACLLVCSPVVWLVVWCVHLWSGLSSGVFTCGLVGLLVCSPVVWLVVHESGYVFVCPLYNDETRHSTVVS